MRLRLLFGLVSVFSIVAVIFSASGSRAFGAAVSSTSVDQPIEVSTGLVAIHEAMSFESVPLRAAMNSVTLNSVTVPPPGIFDINLISSNWNPNQTAQSAVTGDVTGDSWVDHADITFIGDHWLQSGPPTPPGDANADNIVNVFDINFVSANWQPNPIPEPSTLVLLALAVPGLWWIRRATRR